jgi:hypothetical protein
MLISKIFRLLKDLFEVSWTRTLLYNFSNLPFRQAIHCPILLYSPHMNITSYLLHSKKTGGGTNYSKS